MKKTFVLEDLDCANCAAKIENALNEIDEVTGASVSFMSQKLTLEAADEDFEAALQKAEKIISRVDPDVTLIK